MLLWLAEPGSVVGNYLDSHVTSTESVWQHCLGCPITPLQIIMTISRTDLLIDNLSSLKVFGDNEWHKSHISVFNLSKQFAILALLQENKKLFKPALWQYTHYLMSHTTYWWGGLNKYQTLYGFWTLRGYGTTPSTGCY